MESPRWGLKEGLKLDVIDTQSTEVSRVFGLVYGESGTGKTELMGTLGELGKVLIIDIDKGFQTIFHSSRIKQATRDNITVVSFSSFNDLDTLYKLVSANNVEKWNKALAPIVVTQPFDWIVWDTWSELQWTMLQQLRKDKGLLVEGGKDISFRKNIEIQHWGMLTDLNKLAVEQLRECSVNQIFTMQEKTEKDEDTGSLYGGPAIHGKMVQEMPAYFGIVVRTYTDPTGAFCASTKRKGRFPAKTRLGDGKEYKGANMTMKEILKG